LSLLNVLKELQLKITPCKKSYFNNSQVLQKEPKKFVVLLVECFILMEFLNLLQTSVVNTSMLLIDVKLDLSADFSETRVR